MKEEKKMDDERVETFVNILTKESKRRPRGVPPQQLVQHTRHCLTTLIQKQVSLGTALKVLEVQVWPDIVQGIHQVKSSSSSSRSEESRRDKQSSSSSVVITSQRDLPKVLEHVFTQLLRLHDGLILLVSGECRHEGDMRAPKPFPTRLTQNATRADGYTQLYKVTSIYSGASHDEWFDERNGLLTAWRAYFGPKRWDSLLEKHFILEALMSDVETKMQQLQQQFSSLCHRITTDLQRLFPDGHVRLSLQDQMERLNVDPWSWERRGKSFQWKHPLGILPIGWTAQQWQDSLSWQSPTLTNTTIAKIQKRRRRVIDDDDSDAEGDNNKVGMTKNARVKSVKIEPSAAKENRTSNQPLAEGLKVKTKSTRIKSPKDTIDSLNAIKAQMGVNIHALQQAREGLEAEEQVTREWADAVDDNQAIPLHDVADTEARRRHASVRCVQGLVKQLRKIEQRAPTDMYDLWDARECLRQALMEAGNLHLWSYDEATTSEDRFKLLQQSDDYFQRAFQLVKGQKQLHARMVMKASPTEELKMCRRNLLLLQAHALVNRGIAQVELGQRKTISEGIKHLEGAQKECRTLIKAAESDRTSGSSALETTHDSLFARETDSLAMRWKAEATWKLGKKTEAISFFSQVGHAYKDDFKSAIPLDGDLDVFRTYLSFCTESYYAWTRLIDLLAHDVQRTPGTAHFKTKWEWLQTHLKSSFSEAVECSRVLKRDVAKFGERLNTFFVEKDVLDAEDLRNAEQKVMNDLTCKRDISAKSLSSDVSKAALNFERSDVVDPTLTASPNVPSRWLLTGNETFRHRRSRKRYGAGYSNIRVPGAVDDQSSPPVPKKQRYRQWGDDFFPKKKDENGNLVPDLPFPFCAPEMPASIRAVLEQRGTLGGR